MKNPIRLMIVDDHELLRLGLKSLFKYENDITVVAEATDGESAVATAANIHPDVILMDLQMPVLDGVEATRRILATTPPQKTSHSPQTPQTSQTTPKVLILTSFGMTSDVAAALDAGASGAITKDTPNDDLPEIIRRIHAGDTYLSPEIRQSLAEIPSVPSKRQLAALDLVSRGYSSADVARLLDISANAVDQHVTACCRKLGAANRTEAVAIAIEKHLIRK